MYQMEIKDRIALLQSSVECSTGITEGATILYTKWPKMRCPCKAVAAVQSFHNMRQILIQRLAYLQYQSQVRIARAYKSYLCRRKAKEGAYLVTLYWNEAYLAKTEVKVYGNFTNPPWSVFHRMSYNTRFKAYEKTLWMHLGAQFKFIVNGVNKDTQGFQNNVLSLQQAPSVFPRKSPFVAKQIFVTRPGRSRSPKGSKRLPRTQRAPEMGLEGRYEEEKLAEKSNTTTELEIFHDYLEDDDNEFLGGKFLFPHKKTYSEERQRLFFASAVKTIGRNNDVYFMESCIIGIGCPDHTLAGLDLSLDAVCTSQPLSISPKPAECSICHPLGDHSLFGNESDGSISDLGEDEVLSSDLNPAAPKNKGSESSPSVVCALGAGELSCEVNGKALIACLRLYEDKEPEVLLWVSGEVKGDTRRIKVQEGDLLILVSNDISNELFKEEVVECIQTTIKGKVVRTLPPRRFSNGMAAYLCGKCKEQKEIGVTIIAARISQCI